MPKKFCYLLALVTVAAAIACGCSPTIDATPKVLDRVDGIIKAIEKFLTVESPAWRRELQDLERKTFADASDLVRIDMHGLATFDLPHGVTKAAADIEDHLEKRLKDHLRAYAKGLKDARQQIEDAHRRGDREGITNAIAELAALEVPKQPAVTGFSQSPIVVEHYGGTNTPRNPILHIGGRYFLVEHGIEARLGDFVLPEGTVRRRTSYEIDVNLGEVREHLQPSIHWLSIKMGPEEFAVPIEHRAIEIAPEFRAVPEGLNIEIPSGLTVILDAKCFGDALKNGNEVAIGVRDMLRANGPLLLTHNNYFPSYLGTSPEGSSAQLVAEQRTLLQVTAVSKTKPFDGPFTPAPLRTEFVDKVNRQAAIFVYNRSGNPTTRILISWSEVKK